MGIMCDDTILTICFMTRGDLAMPSAPSVLLNFHRQQKHLISTTGALISSSHNSLRGTVDEHWLLKQFSLNHPVEHLLKPKLTKLFVCVETSTSYFISSVRSSNSHPDLLLIHPTPTFSDHTGPQHWTFTFSATTAI